MKKISVALLFILSSLFSFLMSKHGNPDFKYDQENSDYFGVQWTDEYGSIYIKTDTLKMDIINLLYVSK